MWKNVGRYVENHSKHNVKFHLKDVCLGPLTGILLVVTGLITFLVYKVAILVEGDEKRKNALLIHFIMNIVILSLMSFCTAVGCIVYRLDYREHVSEENPSRSLDVGLLVIASVGQFIIGYFTIVAVLATRDMGNLKALNLTWGVLTVLQLSLQNYFIIEGLHRKPFYTKSKAALGKNAPSLLDHTDMNVLIRRNKFSAFASLSRDKPSWKRRVLKEVSAFLLFANIIVSSVVYIDIRCCRSLINLLSFIYLSIY